MKRTYLFTGITIAVVLLILAAVFYQTRYSSLLYGSFTKADIALLEDVGLVAHELADIHIADTDLNTTLWWRRDEEVYYLDDYQIHPEVLASLQFHSPSGFIRVEYEEIQGKDGYEWVIDQNLVPQIDAVATLHLRHSNSEVLIEVADIILSEARSIVREYGALYDDNVENTHDYIAAKGYAPIYR